MASEEKKSGEERLVKTTETKDTKKHRGIPEALFLVSIYLFIIMPSIFDDSASRTYREIPSISAGNFRFYQSRTNKNKPVLIPGM